MCYTIPSPIKSNVLIMKNGIKSRILLNFKTITNISIILNIKNLYFKNYLYDCIYLNSYSHIGHYRYTLFRKTVVYTH